jgi:methylated-DNA-[protein]-cysteine S-methyltransferase
MNPDTIHYDDIATPVGRLRLAADARGLRSVWFDQGRHQHQALPPEWRHSPAALAFATEQLQAYFAGTRQSFDLPLNPFGTPFQLIVWNELKRIPYGITISYGELARRIGKPAAVRAVGAANGRNPLSIVVPCHRVIGADGSLTGFGGGVENKRKLLTLEQRVNGKDLFGKA